MNLPENGIMPINGLLKQIDLSAYTNRAADVNRMMDDAGNVQEYLKRIGSIGDVHRKALAETVQSMASRQTEAGKAVMAEMLKMRSPADLTGYLVDVTQRWVLFMDTLRRRGNNYVEHEDGGCPPVLAYEFDVVMDGSTLPRPVNYTLVRIKAPEGVVTRENGRPYIIIDPRAGHGSGIGGFKSESEVGVALHGGHPVYFAIFKTHPEPGQTLADVTRAEAAFVREVRKRHPESPRPVIVGNCQGGWAAMLLAATNPDLTGPVVLNGSPLSYWSGMVGKNPMRYMGGMAGGVLPAMLLADLGNGEFDGANLVLNFENLNPGNTWIRKYYNVFANGEDESDRYLEFERWWSGFYFMSENEIRWIVENLFVGNKLARGGANLDSRLHVDLRNIRAPVIVFASHGDNITPPAQALNWIPDLYASVAEIKARGQRIIYTVHDSIGHLGIFVSSSVANRQHKEIVSTLKAIEAMAPGLYEMKIVDVAGEGVDRQYQISFEERSIDDILAFGDDRKHEKPFAAVSRMSELNAELYSVLARPVIRSLVSKGSAEALVKAHPLRVRRTLLSDKNPLVAPVEKIADVVRANRKEVASDNPFLQAERFAVDMMQGYCDLYRDVRDAMMETKFFAIYGSPLMQAFGATVRGRISEEGGEDLRNITEVRLALEHVGMGGYPEAVIRMLILLADSRGSIRRDRLERSNEVLSSREPFASLGVSNRNLIIHRQSIIVEFEPGLALETLPALLTSSEDRKQALGVCEYVAGPQGEMSDHTQEMFANFRRVLGVAEAVAAAPVKAEAPQAEAPAPVQVAAQVVADDALVEVADDALVEVAAAEVSADAETLAEVESSVSAAPVSTAPARPAGSGRRHQPKNRR